jgi:NitT/TauT family transport system substrate-binding protein
MRSSLTARAFGGWLCAAIALLVVMGPAHSAHAQTAVKVGYLKEPFNINVVKLADFVDTKKVAIELVPFRQFAEVGRALQAGEIQVAAFGYQNAGIFLDAGFTDFTLVAGISSGGQSITQGKGVILKTWADLSGKKIGVPPNSFVELRLKASLKKAGVNPSQVSFVSFPGAGPPMLAALKNKDVDAIAVWEPLNAQAQADGFGEYAGLDLRLTETGGVTSLLGVRSSWAAANPAAVREIVAGLVKSTEHFNKDKAAWRAQVIEVTGLKPDVAELAMGRGGMDYRLMLKEGQAVLKTFAEAGLLKADHSAAAAKHYDYSHLEAVTGKKRGDLGG